MSKDAIYNVTLALRDRLAAAIAPGAVFVGALDDSKIGTAQLILFLYRVAPNASLRNREHRVPSNPSSVPLQPPPATVYRNALPLDLHYLVTVGSNPAGSEEAFLQSLGAAMQALQLDTELLGAALGNEAVHVSLDPLTSEEMSRIWALFPTANYRTSIAYLVSPVWIDPATPEPLAANVTMDRLDAAPRARLPVE